MAFRQHVSKSSSTLLSGVLCPVATISTIIPIFLVIALGALARKRGFIPPAFLEAANRLVYYLAIPAMIFRAISRSSIGTEFNLMVITATLICVAATFGVALLTAYALVNRRGSGGTFTQCSFHGNLGYIGLAVIFYFLGDAGLVKGSIIAGLIMILQNFLAVLALQLFAPKGPSIGGMKQFISRIGMNPVILSALLGIGYAWWGAPMPLILDRSLQIISGLALPMALLLIGATLSLTLMKKQFFPALLANSIKLLVMPALGALVFTIMDAPATEYLPALILLAAPPATLTYVFAKEMHGDVDLAVAAISVGTIFSALTYSIWLHYLA